MVVCEVCRCVVNWWVDGQLMQSFFSRVFLKFFIVFFRLFILLLFCCVMVVLVIFRLLIFIRLFLQIVVVWKIMFCNWCMLFGQWLFSSVGQVFGVSWYIGCWICVQVCCMKCCVSSRMLWLCLCSGGIFRLSMLRWQNRFLWKLFLVIIFFRLWWVVLRICMLIFILWLLLIWWKLLLLRKCSSLVCRQGDILLILLRNIVFWWVSFSRFGLLLCWVLVKVLGVQLNSLFLVRFFGNVVQFSVRNGELCCVFRVWQLCVISFLLVLVLLWISSGVLSVVMCCVWVFRVWIGWELLRSILNFLVWLWCKVVRCLLMWFGLQRVNRLLVRCCLFLFGFLVIGVVLSSRVWFMNVILCSGRWKFCLISVFFRVLLLNRLVSCLLVGLCLQCLLKVGLVSSIRFLLFIVSIGLVIVVSNVLSCKWWCWLGRMLIMVIVCMLWMFSSVVCSFFSILGLRVGVLMQMFGGIIFIVFRFRLCLFSSVSIFWVMLIWLMKEMWMCMWEFGLW